jgi:cation:H+ antiporter
MPIILTSLILLVSLLVLAKSAEVVVKNLIRAANTLRLSTFVVSFIILGFATSTPEIFVGVNSAFENTPQLSLGNTIGATIVLLTLITGLMAVVTGKVVLDAAFAKKDLLVMNFVILLPVLLLYDARLTRIDAILMLLAYGFYILRVYSERSKLSHPISLNHNSSLWKNFIFLAVGFTGLAIASNFAVDAAAKIAEFLKIPVLMMGILVFSIGTNFPELILTITALRKKQKMIVLGNVMGSATTNTFVIAIVSLIQPFQVMDKGLFSVTVFFLTTSVVMFSFFVKSKNQISRIEGVALLSLYSFFLITEIVLKLI